MDEDPDGQWFHGFPQRDPGTPESALTQPSRSQYPAFPPHILVGQRKPPPPAIRTIAEAVGRTPRHVTRTISGLSAAGMIKRHQRSHGESGTLSNEYSFNGLIREVTPFAREKIQEREEAEARRKAKTAKKGKPGLKS